MGMLAAALGLPPPAAAVASVQSFDGRCDLRLTVVHDPQLTPSPTFGAARARGNGECTGALTKADGRVVHLDGARAGVRAASTGNLSCAGGESNGDGVLSLDGTRIGFEFTEIRGPGTATLDYTGDAGGSAIGQAYVAPDEDPADAVTTCADTGLRSVRVVEHLVSNDLAG
ncbi:MAG: hypothetical protein GEV07_25955 [Streptosporangiales bacterium]|nr:hypothetical protein [Streptosporangiales bacterium]